MDQEQETGRTYSGRGWGFINLSGIGDAPGWFAVPLTVFGALIVFFLAIGLIVRAFESLIQGSPDDVYKILLGLAGVFGAPFVIWRTFVAHQQTVISRETHYTDIFTTAVEQLGATREVVGPPHRTEANLEVRLGAIYALERIAKDSERDHWPIMEVLSAYIRNEQNTGAAIAAPEEAMEISGFTWTIDIKPIRVDVQAAINVIGRRPKLRMMHERGSGLKLDLSGANLQKAQFSGEFRGADFQSSNMTKARFSDCDLVGSELQFSTLTGAVFRDCKIEKFDLNYLNDLDGLSAYDTSFRGMEFYGKMYACIFYGCDFTGADLSSVVFNRVRFIRCDLSKVNFESANFEQACTMTRCNLSGADFSGAKLENLNTIKTSDLEKAIGDSETVLGRRIMRPRNWPAFFQDVEVASQIMVDGANVPEGAENM
ncbi:MAG TPA: pentapeptide repeat-containing protein [Rhizomicrobium sp.]|jgi:uncharacterized protein YjbI with pentapeptide repeats